MVVVGPTEGLPQEALKGMDAFEQVVAEILWRKGYWVRTSVKVELTKEDKVAIELPSSPRWELDVVAYKAGENHLKVVECKSYLDSPGVRFRGFDASNKKEADRFKLFNRPALRQVVFARLQQQFAQSGACLADAKVTLCLACGRIATDADRGNLVKHFIEQEWELWDEQWLHDHLKEMSSGSYENQVSAVVSKLLLRRRLA
jgi:hypothetical protein